MPDQNEHDKPENLVESPHREEKSARNLEEAVDSDGTLEGYFAMNNIRDEETKKALALEKEQKAKKP